MHQSLQRTAALPVIHQAAKQRDRLLHQAVGNEGQGRSKTGPDVVQVPHAAGGRDKLAGACHAPLIYPAVLRRDEGDGLFRCSGVSQAGENTLVGALPLLLHRHFRLHDALGPLISGLFQRVHELLGAFNLPLEIADLGLARRGHVLYDFPVSDRPGNALGFVKLREIIRLGKAQLLKGLVNIFDGLLTAVVRENGELCENGRGGLRRVLLLLKVHGGQQGIGLLRSLSRRCFWRLRGSRDCRGCGRRGRLGGSQLILRLLSGRRGRCDRCGLSGGGCLRRGCHLGEGILHLIRTAQVGECDAACTSEKISGILACALSGKAEQIVTHGFAPFIFL